MKAGQLIVAVLLSFGSALLAPCSHAQPVSPALVTGSTAFCLFEVPPDDTGRRRWVNLGIVQYVELGRGDLRIYFGGGNFGGGYETRIPVASGAEGIALLDRIKQAAATCK